MEKKSSEEEQPVVVPVKHLPKKKRKKIRWARLMGLVGFLVLAGGILFLKFDLGAAAIFTDNVLRPLIGDSRVIYLEGLFFNTSDQMQRLASPLEKPKAPQFIDPGKTNLESSGLDLSPIKLANNFSPLAGEGTWRDYPLQLFPGKEAMAYTFVRPDPARSYAMVTMVQLDMSVMRLGSVAGTQQPGGPVKKPGPGVVPKDVIDSGNLIAAFDGGFQYKDGAYGMIVGNTTYLPLKYDLGTLVGYTDGTLKIVNYTGQSLGSNIAFVRQNCPLLIDNGTITVTDSKDRKLWGRLATGTVGIYTWRSGIGLSKNGNLIFAVGNNLTPDTLAIALQAAGAVNAIQLDINPIWVRFNIFEPSGSGQYTSTTLTKDLADGAKQYLHGYQKDFFYVYKK
ncbi:MAG: phosphodiester glycosidase family protein [Candidatus Pacebacteria bacterium]|nr:phosphodiester glycosidase family protein [Candidatus Paceibacterota bacterium]MDR3582994.1 phosphodiester glycosidase family protein [Candidatus Paceibacterota bacterium]